MLMHHKVEAQNAFTIIHHYCDFTNAEFANLSTFWLVLLVHLFSRIEKYRHAIIRSFYKYHGTRIFFFYHCRDPRATEA